MHKVLY